MVGLPGQTTEDLVEDLLFIKKLEPHMCGIGPFIPHKDTPYRSEERGRLDDVITMLAITRLLLPRQSQQTQSLPLMRRAVLLLTQTLC